MAYHSGFVTLIGRPNVGKSTLLNRLVGTKLSIVSEKPQTTRNVIRGVVFRPDGQIVFLDTPGLHQPKSALERFMVQAAQKTLDDVDVVVWMTDATMHSGDQDREIASLLAAVHTPVLLAVNKIDAVSKGEVVVALDRYTALYPFTAVYPISATRGDGVDALLDDLFERMPEGPPYFPEGTVTDLPESVLVAEIIREKILQLTHAEVPHAVAVVVEEMAERTPQHPEKPPYLEVRATIYVERESQKQIVIGKNGQMLRKIGTEARQELEALLGIHLFLSLWVKVREEWRNRPSALRAFGFTEE
ncbi:MAG: GTPase Era [Firmicutes bacterium]|nr:GTPase Era [Bacillota bacterium]